MTRSIACPDTAPEPAQVTMRIAWPDDLAGHSLWFRFQDSDVVRPVMENYWWARSRLFPNPSGNITLVDPNSAMHNVVYTPAESPHAQRTVATTVGLLVVADPVPLPSILLQKPLNERPEGIVWPGREYVVQTLEILAPGGLVPMRGSAEEWQRFYVIYLSAVDWGYRIEPGTPGTLWLTPTPAAIEQVKEELAKLDQALAAEQESKPAQDAPAAP